MQLATENTATKERARIIIPVWGAKYLARLDAACLPAVLSPGNLPHLAEYFDCELVIVTQSSLFDMVRLLPSVRATEQFCTLRLVAIDDMLSHPSYYGLTITHALYRGFTDLGDAAKDVWCLFLNADFILADGSYRALTARMLAGERCIFAPSYCAIEENVRPLLNRRAIESNGVLSVSTREMAGLILNNMHFTIRAKIINWRMYRIDRVDQFYYLLDNDTLLGRQLPIAVVAFKPERVPLEPVTFWDYGVVSEICPTSKLCVLGDSDDFLMLELRGRNTMNEQFRLGWMDKQEIARDLSIWTTKDQRDCGKFPLVLHRENLPANYTDGLKMLDDHYRDVMRQVTCEPRDHRNHYIWTGVVELHNEWLRSHDAKHTSANNPGSTMNAGGGDGLTPQRSIIELLTDLLKTVANAPFKGSAGDIYRRLFDLMRSGYLSLFGRIPDVGPLHPQWSDLHPVIAEIIRHTQGKGKALSIWTIPGAAIAPHMSRWADEVASSNPDEILDDVAFEAFRLQAPYDFCLLELSRDEFMKFCQLHARLRTIMKKSGTIIVFYQTKGSEQLIERDFKLIANGMPENDTGELHIRGGYLAYLAQQLWERSRGQSQSGRTVDLIKFAIVATLVVPLALIANRRSISREPGTFTGSCTSLCLQVRII